MLVVSGPVPRLRSPASRPCARAGGRGRPTALAMRSLGRGGGRENVRQAQPGGSGMTRPDIRACALWLQRRLGAFVFAVDHPGLAQCAGAHRPGQPCDGSRGKHPCGRWSRDSTADPGVIRAALSRGLRNIGADCGKSGLLVVDEDRPGAFAEYAASVRKVIPKTFTVATSKGRHLYFRQPAARSATGRAHCPAGGSTFVAVAGSWSHPDRCTRLARSTLRPIRPQRWRPLPDG